MMGVIDRSRFDPLLLERARGIKLLALDVDGVLTDGLLYFDNQGNEMKSFSTRDGLGLRLLADSGVLDLAAAWRLVSEGPARLLGLTDRGRLEPGLRADLVVP